MGEEKKEGGEKKEEGKNVVEQGEKKDEAKKEEEGAGAAQEIVLKVDMHCEACARKVARALKGFQGVENVTADCKASKVVVKGKDADPLKVWERIQKKSGRKVELISPLPKPPEDETKQEDKPTPVQDKKDDEPPVAITVVLKVQMHCEACAQRLRKRVRKIKGVESVTTDLANNQVIVKGIVNPEKLVTDVYKRTKKQASIVKDEEKKEEDEKKEEKAEEKKEGEEGKEGDDKKSEMKRSEYWPQRYYYMDYGYAPQMFSDENPHACSVM